jgi:hypothetical protein
MNFCAGFFFLAVWRRAATIAAGPIARYWLASAGCLARLDSCLVRGICLFLGNIFVCRGTAFDGRIRPNRDIWSTSRRMFHDCADMFNKMFQCIITRDPKAICRKLRLDGNTGQGDKAAHENVSRHLWHLHYWLASRWSGRFRLIFLPEWTNAPASRLEPDLRLGARRLSRTNGPGKHECLTHRRVCASTTR